ncbi:MULTISPECIES: hypothetical protein [Flavobacterium]|uniref:hypothetical protein n=1 Tax=Flavobacterium sp. TaxID=239 RepID=UPI002621EEC3|nr:hypothetical protein [Flavobacterium sp.]
MKEVVYKKISKSKEIDLNANFSELSFRFNSLSEQHFLPVTSFFAQQDFSSITGISQTSSSENTEDIAAIFSPQ